MSSRSESKRADRTPCWAGILVLVLLGVAASAPGQNSIRWTTNHYAVTGATPREVRHSINQSRPWKGKIEADGLTNWRLEWRFTVAPTADGCRVSSFSTATTIGVTLPRWAASTNAPEPLKQGWDHYITALGRHEAGHAQIALAAAAELEKRIKELREQPDCEGLKIRINVIGDAVVEDFRRKDQAYDERTRNGATQGATLP
jgi:predicted secreted Zn-dependent protease